MVNAGIAGAVERAGAELLSNPLAWDTVLSGQGTAQLGGSNPRIYIGTTTTPNHGVGTSSQVAEWDKDAKDVTAGATQGFQVHVYQPGYLPSTFGNTNRIMPSEGFYGGTGHYRNGDDVLNADDNLKYGIGRGPLNTQYVYTAMSVSDLNTWLSSHSCSLLVFFIFGAMRNTSSTNTNLVYYWEAGIDSSNTSLSNGCSIAAASSLANPWFQDGTITAPVNSGYTPNLSRNGVSNSNTHIMFFGGGRGGVIPPSAGDYMTGYIKGHRNWTAPNPDQLDSTDKVFWRHDWL